MTMAVRRIFDDTEVSFFFFFEIKINTQLPDRTSSNTNSQSYVIVNNYHAKFIATVFYN